MSKVGVVIPVYNVEEYLRECLDSIVNQTLKELKIIIVNDGSKDSSLNIINEYASKDDRIFVINKSNSGYGDSMNKGLELAYELDVEYIAIMEPDDYISLDGYENLYKLAKENDVELLRANIVSVFYDDNNEKNYFNNSLLRATPHLYDKLINIEDYKEIFNMNSNCAGLFKTGFLKNNNIWFNTTPGASYQDIGFWFQSYALSKKLYFTENRYYHYRRNRPGSSENIVKNIYTICEEMKYIHNFLTNNKDLKEKYNYEYYKTMYSSYRMVLQKIDESKWEEFLNMISTEFKKALDSNDLTIEDVSKISQDLIKIIEDPSSYLNDNIEEMRKAHTSPFFKAK